MRKLLLRSLGFAVLYVGVALASLQFATIHISSSPVWPPAGLAIAAVAVWGLRMGPAVYVAAFAANAIASGHWPSSLTIAGGNTAEALLGGWVLRRIGLQEIFKHIENLAAFVGIAIAGSSVSAAVGVGTLVAFGLAPLDGALSIFTTWSLGNLAGTLVVTPWLLTIRTSTWVDAGSLAVGALASALAFTTDGWSLFLLVPALYWAHRSRSASRMTWTTMGAAIGSVAMTLLGYGPFWAGNGNEALLLLQIFLVVLLVAMLTLGVGRQRRDPSHRPWSDAGVIALALAPLLVGTVFLGTTLQPALAELDNNRQETAEDVVATAWRNYIEDEDGRLAALRAFLESSNVSQAQFQTFVAQTGWTFGPGTTTAVGFAQLVPSTDLEAYQDGIRNDPELPLVVRDGYQVFPPSDADVRAPIHQVYPMAPSPQAIGFDLFQDDVRSQALYDSRDANAAAASAPVAIVQPGSNALGLMVAAPVYRDETLVGYAVTALAIPNASASPAGASGLPHRIVDVTNGDQELFSSFNATSWRSVETVNAWGRSWDVQVQQQAAATSTENAAPWFILGSSGLLSIAMGSVVYAYDSTRERAEKLGSKMADRARRDAERVAEINRLESLDAMRTRFLNIVAHELRTPLMPIRTQTHILKKKSIPGAERSIEILERGSRRLEAVVDDLLVAAKAEAGELTLRPQNVDLAPLAEDAVDAHFASASQAGTSLLVRVEPTMAWADAARVSQVIDNLVTNALKFARGGTVTVIVHDAGGPTIEVVDDGKGIDPETLRVLGRPFAQAADTEGGTGLGLYICQTVARLHGGNFRLTSAGLGRGTTATLKLKRPDT